MIERLTQKYLTLIALNALNFVAAFQAYIDLRTDGLLMLTKFHAKLAWEYAEAIMRLRNN